MIFLIIGVIWYITLSAILDILIFIINYKTTKNQNNEKKRIN